ncbi:MAG: PIN domain-containing protein [Thermodesulfobacteriota bacterium]|nr:PIN domain-containing protein [Thermodesulfobacteriota bacterium]
MKLPKKAYLIDTNVVLRYLLGDHAEFSPRAEAFMADLAKRTKNAEILGVVIVACVHVMEKYYKIPKNEIVEKLSAILNFSGIVNPDRAELLEALLKYENSNIDIVDCILAARSSPEKVVISFDRDIKKLKAVSETL